MAQDLHKKNPAGRPRDGDRLRVLIGARVAAETHDFLREEIKKGQAVKPGLRMGQVIDSVVEEVKASRKKV